MQDLIRVLELTCRNVRVIRNTTLAFVSELVDSRPDRQALARNLRLAAARLRRTKRLLDEVCPLLRELFMDRRNSGMVRNARSLLRATGKKAQRAGLLLKAAGRQMLLEGGFLQQRGVWLQGAGDYVQRMGIVMQQDAADFISRNRW